MRRPNSEKKRLLRRFMCDCISGEIFFRIIENNRDVSIRQVSPPGERGGARSAVSLRKGSQRTRLHFRSDQEGVGGWFGGGGGGGLGVWFQ